MSAKTKIRILLADDHTLMRMGLSALIASEKDMEVVGEAENGLQAVELALSLKPDIVIMDLMMPELSGAAATQRIHDADPAIKIMILTTFGTSAEMAQAIANGAVGALMKDTATDDLVSAIRAIVAGKRVIPARLQKLVEEDNPLFSLSDRQLEILTSVARGLSNAEIARQFNLSEITIKKHLSAIFEHLGVSNRTEAAALALRKQLLKV